MRGRRRREEPAGSGRGVPGSTRWAGRGRRGAGAGAKGGMEPVGVRFTQDQLSGIPKLFPWGHI